MSNELQHAIVVALLAAAGWLESRRRRAAVRDLEEERAGRLRDAAERQTNG